MPMLRSSVSRRHSSPSAEERRRVIILRLV